MSKELNKLNKLNKLNNRSGFSLIELLISMAILGILLAAIAAVVHSQNKHHAAQNEIVEMQNNARMAMDFVTRTLRSGTDGEIIIGGTVPNKTIKSAHFVEVIGTATGGDSNSLNDGDLSDEEKWEANEWNHNCLVTIIGGTGKGQTRDISDTFGKRLDVEPDWNTVPDATSVYKILVFNKFERDSDDDILRFSRKGATRQPLAENITAFTVTQVGSRVDITITAQTANKLPTTNKYGTITFKSSVHLRN